MKRPSGDYPNPDYWDWLRDKVITERGAKCQAIAHHTREAGYQLELHHTHYNTWGHERLEDVLLLCNICHEAITDIQRRERYNKRDIASIKSVNYIPNREMFISEEKDINVVEYRHDILQRDDWRK